LTVKDAQLPNSVADTNQPIADKPQPITPRVILEKAKGLVQDWTTFNEVEAAVTNALGKEAAKRLEGWAITILGLRKTNKTAPMLYNAVKTSLGGLDGGKALTALTAALQRVRLGLDGTLLSYWKRTKSAQNRN